MRWITTLPVAAFATLALTACGGNTGDGGPAKVRPATGKGAAPASRVIATLGDSIVAGSPQWDPDKSVRDGFPSVDENSQWQRTVQALPPADLRNCGAWGERTDQIAGRFDTCAKGADAIVIQGGINDIVQGRPVKDAARDLGCLVDRAIAADLPVAIADVLPWNNGYPDAAPEIRDLNKRIHAIAKARGIPTLPFFGTLEDPKAKDRMRVTLTIEGDHPNVAGYRLIGREAWREPETGTIPTGAPNCDQ